MSSTFGWLGPTAWCQFGGMYWGADELLGLFGVRQWRWEMDQRGENMKLECDSDRIWCDMIIHTSSDLMVFGASGARCCRKNSWCYSLSFCVADFVLLFEAVLWWYAQGCSGSIINHNFMRWQIREIHSLLHGAMGWWFAGCWQGKFDSGDRSHKWAFKLQMQHGKNQTWRLAKLTKASPQPLQDFFSFAWFCYFGRLFSGHPKDLS